MGWFQIALCFGLAISLSPSLARIIRTLPRKHMVIVMVTLISLIGGAGFIGFLLGGIDAGYRERTTALNLIRTTDAAFAQAGCDEVRAAFGAAKAAHYSGATVEDASRELLKRLGAAARGK